MARLPAALIAVALAGAQLAASAGASQLAALDLGFSEFAPSTARDVNAAGEVFVEGAAVPTGDPTLRAIVSPPHPGGSVLALPCYPVCGSGTSSLWDRPGGITETGRVFGARQYGTLPPYTTAVSWSPPTYAVQNYTPPPGAITAFGVVRDMNTGGASVGTMVDFSPVPTGVPCYWSSPTAAPVVLGQQGSSAEPQPLRLNDAGLIVGGRLGTTPRAIYWPSLSALEYSFLGELPGGATSHALDLDSLGRVVGSSDGGGGVQRAVLWRPSGGAHAVVELPVPFLGGSCQQATAISESSGWIAGNCTTAAGDRRGVIWRDDGASVSFVHELMPLAGHDDSAVYGLGGSRLAAGSSGDPPTAVLWNLPLVPAVPASSTPGLALLLMALVAGFVLAQRRRR